jgi:hypothetical protein
MCGLPKSLEASGVLSGWPFLRSPEWFSCHMLSHQHARSKGGDIDATPQERSS